MKETVSIIIPVYNSEPYLSRCLDSVLAQTYSEIEVLLIDDGSTDNSYALCQQYAQSDSRVKVLHQDNQGAAAARNTGLDNATGDYIMFCDSDDLVSELWVEHLVQYVANNRKIIMPLSLICHDISLLGKSVIAEIESNILVLKNQLYLSKIISLIGCDVNTIFFTSVLSKNHLRFRSQKDKADYNEDLLFVTTYLNYVDGFVYTGYADYAYITRDDSLSRTITPFYFEKYAEKYKVSASLIQQYGTLDDLKSNASYFLYHFLISYKDAVKCNNYQRFEEIVNSDVLNECLLYADMSKEDKREMKLLKGKRVTLLWIYNQLKKMRGR